MSAPSTSRPPRTRRLLLRVSAVAAASTREAWQTGQPLARKKRVVQRLDARAQELQRAVALVGRGAQFGVGQLRSGERSGLPQVAGGPHVERRDEQVGPAVVQV